MNAAKGQRGECNIAGLHYTAYVGISTVFDHALRGELHLHVAADDPLFWTPLADARLVCCIGIIGISCQR
jgi:hypothetical protein